MDWGMKSRLAKLVKPDSGRSVWLAMDHGYFLGPVQRLENRAKLSGRFCPMPTRLCLPGGYYAIVLTRRLLQR